MFKNNKFDIGLGDLVYVYPYNVWGSALGISPLVFKGMDLPEYKEELSIILSIDPVRLDHVLKTDDHFSDRDKEIMYYYFRLNKTMSDLAEHYDLSHERIRQIINKNLRKLRYIPALKNQFVTVTVKRKKEDEQKMKEKLIASLAEKTEPKKVTEGVSVEELDLSARTFNCCYRGGYRYIDDFIGVSLNKLLSVRNMGEKSLKELLNALTKYNIYPVRKDGEPWVNSVLTFAKNSSGIVKEERKE